MFCFVFLLFLFFLLCFFAFFVYLGTIYIINNNNWHQRVLNTKICPFEFLVTPTQLSLLVVFGLDLCQCC